MRIPWKKALAGIMIACFLLSSITAMAAESVTYDDSSELVAVDEVDSALDYMGGGYKN